MEMIGSELVVTVWLFELKQNKEDEGKRQDGRWTKEDGDMKDDLSMRQEGCRRETFLVHSGRRK